MSPEELAAIHERRGIRLPDAPTASEDIAALLAEVERLTGVVGEAVHFLSSGHGFSAKEGLVELRKILDGDAAEIYQKTLVYADALQARLDKVRALRQGGVCWICVEVLDEALDGSDQ